MKVAVLALVIVLAVFHPAVVMAQTSAGDRVKTEAEDNETLRRAREDRLANSRRVVQEFAARVKEASDVFAGLQSEVQKFQSRLDKLQTDDDGKRLARDNPAVMHIMDLQKAPPVVESQVVAKKGFLDGLLKALNEELNRPNVGYIPPTERKEDVERAVLWATDRLGTIRAEQGWLDKVISKAPKLESGKASPTLRDVINQDVVLRIKQINEARINAGN